MLRLTAFAGLALLLTLTAVQAQEIDEPFDKPVKSETVDLPKDPVNPDADRVVTCDYYPAFMVKQVDFGEVGAEKLAVLPATAPCEETTAGEKLVQDEMAGYYLGAKGDYLFFQTADGWNGGLPFTVMKADALTHLFDDSADLGENGDAQLFSAIALDGTALSIEFTRVYSSECSLVAKDGDCAKTISAATGLASLPDCGPAYDAEKKRTPDYASEIDASSSVIVYPAKLVFDGSSAKVTPLPGDASCRVPN